MDILTPDEIKTLLFDRLNRTQRTFDNINVEKEEDTDIVQTIYFKYYFDFSTAIESSITSIMTKKYPDEFANKKMKITDLSTSNYLNTDEIKYISMQGSTKALWKSLISIINLMITVQNQNSLKKPLSITILI